MAGPARPRLVEPSTLRRELNADIVRRVLREQFPELAEGSIEFHGWGCEHDAYIVDGRWLFRFPRHAGSGNGMEGEAASMDRVAPAVGDAFRVPHVSLWGAPSAHFPYRFFGSAFIPGVGSDHPTAPWAPELADDLGRALTRLHSIPFTSEEQAEAEATPYSCRDPRNGTLWCLEQLPHVRELGPAEWAWLEDESIVPADFAGEPRFIHGDLHPEHILVDRLTGRLTGIVDWGPTIGDPARDLEFLVIARGQSFLERTLRTYELRIDPELIDRSVYFAGVRALGWLADAVRRGVSIENELQVVRRTFATER